MLTAYCFLKMAKIESEILIPTQNKVGPGVIDMYVSWLLKTKMVGHPGIYQKEPCWRHL